MITSQLKEACLEKQVLKVFKILSSNSPYFWQSKDIINLIERVILKNF